MKEKLFVPFFVAVSIAMVTLIGLGVKALMSNALVLQPKSEIDLFEITGKPEKKSLLPNEVDAWNVKVRKSLLTEKQALEVNLNLPDGYHYLLKKDEQAPVEPFFASGCNTNKCKWVGYITSVNGKEISKTNSRQISIYWVNNDIRVNVPMVNGVNEYAYTAYWRNWVKPDPGLVLYKIDLKVQMLD